MKDLVKQEIFSIISDCVIEKPKDKKIAHYASPIAFSLAKEYRKSPKNIAEELALKFKDSDILDASALNGYLNFKLKTNFLQKQLDLSLKYGENFAKKNLGGSLLIEYISANPTGPLHIGHVRGAVYGDSLYRLAKYFGINVLSEYYVNDAGNQIELLGLSIALTARKGFGEDIVFPEKYYRGEYINDIIKLAESKFGKEIFYDNNRILELANFAKDFVLELIKKDLKNANIFIENWISEIDLYDQLNDNLEILRKSGGLYKSNDCEFIASSKFSDDSDRVVIRSDGRPTYLAGDIIYHNYKFKRGFDNYINIWGADHHGYVARIKAAIKFLGYDDDKLEVLLMQMVSLLKDHKPYKISKRDGTAILMSDILNEIGSDALRFIFISKSNNTNLEFEIDELKKQDSSNPVFYINYAHARINQIFNKANKKIDDILFCSIDDVNSDALNLLYEALVLGEILQDALNTRQLYKICDYLKSLCSNFHKFYNENRVVGEKNENALLKIFAMVSLSIRTALGLLGIKAKDKM